MTSDDLELVHPSAQAAESDVRAAHGHAINLEQCSLFVDSPPLRRAMTDAAAFLRKMEAALSAEADGTIAAARLAAEEMRERAAKVCEAESLKPAYREWEGGYYSGFHDAADIIRHLPLPSSPKDQQKATATPTIADPDGEAHDA